jgi:hypothetical protein
MLTPLVWLYQGPIGLAYVAAAAILFPVLRRAGILEPPQALDFEGTDMRGKTCVVTGCNTGIGTSWLCFSLSLSLSCPPWYALVSINRSIVDPLFMYPQPFGSTAGYHTALKIAQMGSTVVMACRSPQRAEEAKARMETALKGSNPTAFPFAASGRLVCLTLDLSSFASIKQFAADFRCVSACLRAFLWHVATLPAQDFIAIFVSVLSHLHAAFD